MLESLLPDEILALTIYGEARGEFTEGQIAVANVIMNRWKTNPTKYKTVRDVCLEKLQFSCWNDNDPNYPKLLLIGRALYDNKPVNEIMKQCLYIARGAMGMNFLDNTKGAKYYMTYDLLNSPNRPKWADVRIKEVRIGNHVFFNT